MTFEHHLTEFAGLPVAAYPTDPAAPLPDPGGPCAWHLAAFFGDQDWDEMADLDEVFQNFLERVDTSRVEALIVGAWDESAYEGSPVDLVVAAAARFPNLRALFWGDILREQSDVAYIQHPPLTRLLEAFPNLTELWVRGRSEDSLVPLVEPTKHERLNTLVFESGGLPAATIRAIGECDFPELTHLEFYFGMPHYGGDATPEDVAWLLAGDRFPKLRRLGLRDSILQDDLAAAVAHAPVVAQLEVLDLSLGTLGDEGAAALLAGQPLHHLRKLDLHHHYVSDKVVERLQAAWPGVEVDTSEQDDGRTWRQAFGSPPREDRYIAVSE